ncbi:unnamed protein product [Urochloa decumbens]|uniref:F-box domain-containing protein n=1 Tax=Urochloa decumbens TaxID=240449 RepID=A0ABC9FU24_9POAL
MKHTIPDDILEDIFLRLDSDVWLLRAASTCRQWCRVVSDTSFHRRFRTIHGPPIAGVFYVKGAEDWRQRQWLNFEPMPSAAAIDDRHLSLDFLPDSDPTPRVWSIRDTRGSLLLLQRCPEVGDYGHPDLVVCDPIAYEVISTRRLVPCRNCDPIAYLLDGEAAGGISVANFRLAFWLYSSSGYGKPAHYDAAVLSFGRNHVHSMRQISIGAQERRSMGHTTVAVYWYTGQGKVLAFDKTSADFSCSLLPDMEEWSLPVGQTELGVTAGRDGKDRVVHSGDGGKMKVFVRLQGSSGDWGLEKIIELSMVTCGLPGYLPWVFSEEPAIIEILRSPMLVLRLQRRLLWYGLDVVTGEAEDVSGFVDFPHPCELPWPPRLPCVR